MTDPDAARLDADRVATLLRDDPALLAPIAQAVHDAGAAARALLDFCPGDVNPLILTRERVEAVIAAAGTLRELLEPTVFSSGTAHAIATDPVEVGDGSIAGPGGPFDRGGVVLDVRNAVLHDATDVAIADDAGAIALLLSGRVNKREERVRLMFLTTPDGAAGLCAEVLGLVKRAGEDIAAPFAASFERRMREVPQ